MSKNAPKIILVIVCIGAAVGLIFYNMSNSNDANSAINDDVVGTSQEETDELNENLEDDEVPALQGLVKPSF